MGELIAFPAKREPKNVEDIYRREFGYVICPHKVYLPNQFCQPCADKAAREVDEILFNAAVLSTSTVIATKPATTLKSVPLEEKKHGRVMKWFKSLLGNIASQIKKTEKDTTIFYCSGGCGRTMESGKPVPDFNSRMLPLTADCVPRYEKYKYLTGFKCSECCERDTQKE